MSILIQPLVRYLWKPNGRFQNLSFQKSSIGLATQRLTYLHVVLTENKIIKDKAEGIVVAPQWCSQPWYPIFKSLLVVDPLIFSPNIRLISFSRAPHPCGEIAFWQQGMGTYAYGGHFVWAKTLTHIVTLENVLEFLTFHFHRGATYSTLNSYKYRLYLILQGRTWDRIFGSSIVLSLVKTLKTETLPLETVSKKLAVLLTLATGQRLQTISLIKVSNISIQSQRILIRIPDRIKTSAINRSQPILNLSFFVDEPQVRLIGFLLFSKNRKTSTSTITRWIKDILERSGLDMSIFKPQRTRHASSFSAARAGVSFATIRLAAGGSHNSRMFASFYNRPLVDNNQFAKISIICICMVKIDFLFNRFLF
nr:unnamed protein product [Callosobruchus chinensis]